MREPRGQVKMAPTFCGVQLHGAMRTCEASMTSGTERVCGVAILYALSYTFAFRVWRRACMTRVSRVGYPGRANRSQKL